MEEHVEAVPQTQEELVEVIHVVPQERDDTVEVETLLLRKGTNRQATCGCASSSGS